MLRKSFCHTSVNYNIFVSLWGRFSFAAKTGEKRNDKLKCILKLGLNVERDKQNNVFDFNK